MTQESQSRKPGLILKKDVHLLKSQKERYLENKYNSVEEGKEKNSNSEYESASSRLQKRNISFIKREKVIVVPRKPDTPPIPERPP